MQTLQGLHLREKNARFCSKQAKKARLSQAEPEMVKDWRPHSLLNIPVNAATIEHLVLFKLEPEASPQLLL